MTAPHLLLVDDSQAILSYETAVLGGHYSISTALNGKEALRLAADLKPNVVLLDLSMPEMDGFEVLLRMKADPMMTSIPIIVISTEQHRAEECIDAGAAEFVAKPIRADTLRAVVARVLAEVDRGANRESIGLLFIETSRLLAAMDLDRVIAAALQPTTVALSTSSAFLREAFEFRGAPVCVFDLAAWLGTRYVRPVVDRKLVIVKHDPLFAVIVDDVHMPELVARTSVLTSFEDLNEVPNLAAFGAAVVAVVQGDRGLIPVVDLPALVPKEVMASIPETFRASGLGPASGGIGRLSSS